MTKKCAVWITDHVCRHCLSPVVQRVEVPHHYQCSLCDAAANGSLDALCACGTRSNSNRDQRLRCTVLPASPDAKGKHAKPRARVGVAAAPAEDIPAPLPAMPLPAALARQLAQPSLL